MKNKIYAISLLLSFLVVLSHQVISHHHHDTMADDFITSHVDTDEYMHEYNNKHHHHDSQEKRSNEKDTDKDHNHPFPLHQHVSATNDFDYSRANIQETNSNNHSIKIFVGLYLLYKQYSEPANRINYSFGEPPFLINSLFYPGTIVLRGPPSV